MLRIVSSSQEVGTNTHNHQLISNQDYVRPQRKKWLSSFSDIASKVTQVSRGLFGVHKPPEVVFENVPLPIGFQSSIEDISTEKRKLSKEELLYEVFLFYGIQPTQFERRYPPMGLDVTLGGCTNDRNFLKGLQLLYEQLNKFTESGHTSYFPVAERLYDLIDQKIGEVFPQLWGVSLYSKTSYRNSFSDEDIILALSHVYDDKKRNVGVDIPRSEKPIFFQFNGESALGCVVAMLVYEYNSMEEVYRSFYKLKTLEAIEQNLRRNHLVLEKIPYIDLDYLSRAVEQHPVVVSIDSFDTPPSFCRPHYVIVDEVCVIEGVKTVKIRDPYHGWCVGIKAEAFVRRLVKQSPLLQIKCSLLR